MDCSAIWEDCINKLEDLDFPIDSLSDSELPTLPLSSDANVGPLVLKAMCDVLFLRPVHDRSNPWKPRFPGVPSRRRSVLWIASWNSPSREGFRCSLPLRVAF